MLPKPVQNKGDFVSRYQAGEFGNRALTWPDATQYLASHYMGLVHIRNRVAGGPTYYNLSYQEAYPKWEQLVDSGIDPATLYISAMAPHHLNVIQGEVIRSHRHLDLYYTLEPDLPMRDALAKSAKQVYGVTARSILRTYLNQRSYDWMEYLLDQYPGHVVEFSVFGRCWGTVPGYNTVFWEVRKY